jgi:tRNA_anti-like
MKSWIKIILGLAVLGIATVFLIIHFVINKPHPDFEKIKPDYSLHAGAFYNEFKTSKDNAHKLYNGKVIEITGKLARIENTDTLTIAVFVFNQGKFGDEGIRCTMLKKFSAEAKKLKPDEIIRVKGYCTGFNETDVIMEHCSIIY